MTYSLELFDTNNKKFFSQEKAVFGQVLKGQTFCPQYVTIPYNFTGDELIFLNSPTGALLGIDSMSSTSFTVKSWIDTTLNYIIYSNNLPSTPADNYGLQVYENGKVVYDSTRSVFKILHTIDEITVYMGTKTNCNSQVDATYVLPPELEPNASNLYFLSNQFQFAGTSYPHVPVHTFHYLGGISTNPIRFCMRVFTNFEFGTSGPNTYPDTTSIYTRSISTCFITG